MTIEFGPLEFFISQWPKVPEQLFRLLPRSDVLHSFLPRSLGFSYLSLFLVRDISRERYSLYVRNSDVLGLFSVFFTAPLRLPLV